MEFKIYQADAFTHHLFGGNPAAVVPLEKWPDDGLMQNIAAENNLAETAFYVKNNEHFQIRWFTPNTEVDLCGHATLAAAFVLFNFEGFSGNEIIFASRSGELKVTRQNDLLTLDFPGDDLNEIEIFQELLNGFNNRPIKVLKGKTDYMLVFENEKQVATLSPDFKEVAKLKARGVIATAKGDEVDFVSRFFAPQCGIDEDPVTGSAHTSLAPYWSKILNKTEMNAIQISKRKGFLNCRISGNRVLISGKAKLYLEGKIIIE
ncbi:MAG: PhzF family phenazine biosynthesis protein [Bacteroidia bacterium]|nr:PhzF family phenazine biosynthesis protein [Bacteroidia bacterium]